MILPKVRILLCILCGIMLGLVMLSIHLSDDPQFKQMVCQKIFLQLGDSLNCDCLSQLDSVDIVTGTLEFKRVGFAGRNGQWRAHAQTVTLSFSWLDLILHRSLVLSLAAQDVEMFSMVSDTGYIAAQEPILTWLSLQTVSIPATLKSIIVRRGLCTLHNESHQTTSSFSCSGELNVGMHALQITSALSQGNIVHGAQTVAHNLAGSCRISIPYSYKDIRADAQLNCDIELLGIAQPHCLIAFTWTASRGECFVRTDLADTLLRIIIDHDKFVFSGKIPVSCIASARHITAPLSGSVSYSGSTLLSAPLQHLTSTVSCKDARYATYPLPDFDLTITGGKHILVSGTVLYKEISSIITGSWSLDHNNGSLSIRNEQPFELPYLGAIAPQKASLSITCTTDTCTGDYALTTEKVMLTGTLMASSDKITTQAHLHDDIVRISCKHMDGWYLDTIEHLLKHELQARIVGAADGTYTAQLEYVLIKRLLKGFYDYEPIGTGSLMAQGVISWQKLTAHIIMANGQIHLPMTYNVLETVQADAALDFLNHKITVNDAHFTLNKGNLTILHAAALYNTDYTLHHLYLPLLLSDCFVHWKKDIVGEVSGFLITQYTSGLLPTIEGQIVLNHAYVQSNVLSSDFNKQLTGGIVKPFALYQHDALLNIALSTQSPVPVKTPFLETACSMHLAIRGSLTDPHVVGALDLMGGSLNFPYEPLYLTAGHLYFLPHQLEDPVIELIAKNTIKKYSITMNVSGDLNQPRIMFDASPSLTEGQIITLLLGGSDDGSLYLAMPASLTSNIESLLFGPSESTSAIKKSLQALFKPFKHVRIVPSFSDEYGRGGLRGSIVIDINDRLRATIQQNFTLTEDTRFDIEYALSDSMAAHIVKDERRDLGFELEKVWKF